MRVTVLWEDQRSGRLAGFGAHDLLVSLVADALGRDRWQVARLIESVPKNGNTKLLAALSEGRKRLGGDTEVCGVFDRDRAHEMWPRGAQPARCNEALRDAVRARAEGDYYLVFLHENMETLVSAAAARLHVVLPQGKPDHDTRDRILTKAAFEGLSPQDRAALAAEVKGLARLVEWAAKQVKEAP